MARLSFTVTSITSSVSSRPRARRAAPRSVRTPRGSARGPRGDAPEQPAIERLDRGLDPRREAAPLGRQRDPLDPAIVARVPAGDQALALEAVEQPHQLRVADLEQIRELVLAQRLGRADQLEQRAPRRVREPEPLELGVHQLAPAPRDDHELAAEAVGRGPDAAARRSVSLERGHRSLANRSLVNKSSTTVATPGKARRRAILPRRAATPATHLHDRAARPLGGAATGRRRHARAVTIQHEDGTATPAGAANAASASATRARTWPRTSSPSSGDPPSDRADQQHVAHRLLERGAEGHRLIAALDLDLAPARALEDPRTRSRSANANGPGTPRRAPACPAPPSGCAERHRDPRVVLGRPPAHEREAPARGRARAAGWRTRATGSEKNITPEPREHEVMLRLEPVHAAASASMKATAAPAPAAAARAAATASIGAEMSTPVTAPAGPTPSRKRQRRRPRAAPHVEHALARARPPPPRGSRP